MNRLQIATLLLPALLAVGCSREAEDWRSAQAADTPESYAQFLQQHADSAQAATATTRMEQLAEDRDWQIASAEDSAAAYQNFVTQHPDGKWAQEGRIRVENFALNQSVTDSTAGATPTSEAAVDVAKPSLNTGSASGFGVQLGAFSSEAGAQAQWKSLAAKYKSELAGQSHHVSPRKSGNSQIYRLQVARASEQQARDLCTRLKAKGQSCVVVLP